jgi:hypothetical protein
MPRQKLVMKKPLGSPLELHHLLKAQNVRNRAGLGGGSGGVMVVVRVCGIDGEMKGGLMKR